MVSASCPRRSRVTHSFYQQPETGLSYLTFDMSGVDYPTTGIIVTEQQVQTILSQQEPPLLLKALEPTELGYNNFVHFITTECGKRLVLKVGGKYWVRRKTEAEAAGIELVQLTCPDLITVPKVLASNPELGKDGIPWEWVLEERLDGQNLAQAWDQLLDSDKTESLGCSPTFSST